MTKNVCSTTDKTIRIIAGLAILAAGWYYQSYWGFLGLIPLATVAMSWCPLYSLLGINTCSMKTRT